MKTVKYQIWEFPEHNPHDREVPLSVFIYDVPYLLVCRNVLPPLHHLNHILKEGGNAGGMGPGATWEPFTISKSEYEELVKEVAIGDLNGIKKVVRFADGRAVTDDSFDHIKDYFEWRKAVSEKHRGK